MKVWVTKYALTNGIEEVEVNVNENLASVVGARFPTYYHGEGKEWHRTREQAVKRAEDMRAARLKSLSKQVKRIEALTF